MALSRVERIKQEKEQLFLEMEGKNKNPKNVKKILVAFAALAVTTAVVYFGIQLMDDKSEAKSSKTITKKDSKSALPVINFENPYTEITAGDSFDLEEGVVLTDDKDSSSRLKSGLEISSTPEFDASKEGSYTITYKLTDSDNHTVEKTKTIDVKSSKPSILVENSYVEIEAGTNYDLKDGVSIVNGDQSLLKQIKVSSTPEFNKNKVNEYNVKFSVTDSKGNVIEASKKVTVKAKTSTNTNSNTNTNINTNTNSGTSNSTDKESPVLLLDSLEQTIAVGTKINLNAAVTKTTDNVDANHEILATLKISSNPAFNNNQAGIYKVSYTVHDKAGNTRTKVKTITIK